MGPLLFALGLQGPLEKLGSEFPQVRVLAYLDDVYLQGPAADVERAFRRFSQLCKSIGLDMATEKCEGWSPGDPAGAQELSERLGMKFADQGLVAAGCPLVSEAFVQSEANYAADQTVQLIKRVLELPLSAQDKQLLLRRSLQLRILHLARVARKSEVLGAIRKVETAVLAGVLHIMKCLDVQVDTAQMSLPVRLGGLGIHLLSDCDGAACDAAFLAAAAFTSLAVSAGSEHFDPFKGASGVQLAAFWSHVYDRAFSMHERHCCKQAWC